MPPLGLGCVARCLAARALDVMLPTAGPPVAAPRRTPSILGERNGHITRPLDGLTTPSRRDPHALSWRDEESNTLRCDVFVIWHAWVCGPREHEAGTMGAHYFCQAWHS